jgi:DNA topoisomerase-1
MANAVYDSVTTDVESAGHIFRSSYSSVKFAGFTAVYEEGRDDEPDEQQSSLPVLNEGEEVKLSELIKEQKFTQPPARYTEATLIKEMEESGIGRPSTYAPTISTILDREYVIKEGKNLRPTPLGEVVTTLMKERFSDIVDPHFTAHMEEMLDSIEKGTRQWKDVLSDFYGPFKAELDNAETALEGERIKIPVEETDEICEVCGRKMVIKSGRFGRFLACPGYPECTFTKPLVIEMPGKCPNCGSRILKRTSKKGYVYYACERGADCGFMTWDVPVKDNCPECGHTLFKKSGRGFKKPFCINEKCPNFLPEDQRGYRKKQETEASDAPENSGGAEKQPAKASTKKAAKATTKTAAKTTKKTATKTSAKAKKSTADTGKTTTKKTSTKETTKKTTSKEAM